MTWKIVTDSGCDLRRIEELAEHTEFQNVPLTIQIGSEIFVDDEGLDVARCSAPPRTASRRQSPYRTVGIVCSNSSMLAISAFMFSIQAPSVGKGHGWAGFLA